MTRLLQYLLIGIWSVFLTPHSLAGSIQSGGGELYSDRLNPWFLQNTQVIRYCIAIDEQNFGVDLATATVQVERAFAFWKKEFSSVIIPPMQSHRFEVATQTFQETSCDQSHDITFQLGILTDEQKTFLKTPNEFIGVAVRDEYDPASLRSRGYIYIAPAYGPLKYSGKNLAENAWDLGNGVLLANVIAHELGHVFGLPHYGSPIELMGQRFPETLMNETFAAMYARKNIIPPVLSLYEPATPEARCIGWPQTGHISRFFGIPPYWNCFHITYDHDGVLGTSNLKVFGAPEVDDPEVLVATAELVPVDHSYLAPGVQLWVTPEQSLFPLPGTKGVLLEGARFPQVTKKGTLECSLQNCSREIFVRFEAGTAFVGGVLDGQLIYNLFRQND